MRSRFVCASLRSASRWRIVASHLERRLRLPHLLRISLSSTLAIDLPAPHRVAELDVDGLQPAVDLRHRFDRRGADQVADDRESARRRRRA